MKVEWLPTKSCRLRFKPVIEGGVLVAKLLSFKCRVLSMSQAEYILTVAMSNLSALYCQCFYKGFVEDSLRLFRLGGGFHFKT